MPSGSSSTIIGDNISIQVSTGEQVFFNAMSIAFISYSHEDQFFAELLAQNLANLGIEFFYDKMIPPGSHWRKALDSQIASAEFFLVVLSPSYLASEECSRQLRLAIMQEGKGKTLTVPLLIKTCKTPAFLASKACADFRMDYATGFDMLSLLLLDAGMSIDLSILPGYPVRAISAKERRKFADKISLAAKRELGPPSVFLCHAVEDKTRIGQIYYVLGASGLNPWYDKTSLSVGDRWRGKIIKSIQKADYFAVFLSHASVKKTGFIQKELRTAIQEYQRRPEGVAYIVPARLDGCRVPEIELDATTSLSDLQWIDLPSNKPDTIWKLALQIWKQWAERHDMTRKINSANDPFQSLRRIKTSFKGNFK